MSGPFSAIDRRVIQGSSPWIVNAPGGLSVNSTIVGGSVHIEATLEIRGESVNATVTNWDGIRGESINAHVSDFSAMRGESINTTVTNWDGIRGESVNVTVAGGCIHVEATAEIVGASVNAHVSDFTAMRGESINATVTNWSGIRGESINVTVAGGSIHVEATAEVVGASVNAHVSDFSAMRGESINATVTNWSGIRGESINVTVAGGSIHVEATAELTGASMNATVTNWSGIRGESINAHISDFSAIRGESINVTIANDPTVDQGTSPWITRGASNDQNIGNVDIASSVVLGVTAYQGSSPWTVGKVDSTSDALVNIPLEHNLAHEGEMYRVSYLAAGIGNGVYEDTLIKVPANIETHVKFLVEVEGTGWANLYRGPTITSSGATVESFNMDETSGSSNATSFHRGVTIANTGVTISTNLVGAGDKNFAGGGARSNNEWILNSDENYLLRVINQKGDSGDVAISAEYYEKST